ncbi:MAG: orotidine-5'-phosphate decarboxylase [Acidobacteriota bacterium]
MPSLTRAQAIERVCLALDFPEPAAALSFVTRIKGCVGMVKIGLELFCAGGDRIVKEVQDAGLSVFLDLKFHDIPNTVAGASRVIAKLGVDLLTIHAAGGADMMAAAVHAVREGAAQSNRRSPKVVGITVLTSLDDALLAETLGIDAGVESTAIRLAQLAARAGLSGVVASPLEIRAIRKACGDTFMIITPGIRLPSDDISDQRRVLTPRQAVTAGADLLVIGRPIRDAADPVRAAETILDDIQAA